MSRHKRTSPQNEAAAPDVAGVSRRKLVGWVLAAPTLVVAARLGLDSVDPARAKADALRPAEGNARLGPAIPCSPQFYDSYDQSDLLTDSCRPTNNLLTIAIDSSGNAVFAMPRAEVGQGITTAVSMLVAEELDLPVSRVQVSLADADPALLYNQLTGGSNTVHSLYEPVRTAAATARSLLKGSAAKSWGVDPARLSTSDGFVHHPDGRKLSYGALSESAASDTTRPVSVQLKSEKNFSIIGRPQNRVDGHQVVTGTKQFAMDVKVPNAMPTMICRPPTLKGTVRSVKNADVVKRMPGITDVGVISTGVAVRGRTFGQCIDAIRALQVDWGPGTIDGVDNAMVGKELEKGELPMAPAAPGTDALEHVFTFNFRSGSPLETNCAVADVRPDSAEVWSSLKCPIVFAQNVAALLGLAQDKVKVHVSQGGGSFGRHLFHDAGLEAVEASKLFGKPVRLMWHRTDDFRHGRVHPMARSRARASMAGGSVTAFEVRHTAVACDFTHGFGEAYSQFLTSRKPYGDLSVAEGLFVLETGMPYNYGQVDLVLNEVYEYDTFATSAVRNVYSPDTATVRELMTDQIANALGVDPVEYRRHVIRSERMRAVLDKCVELGKWGRKMPAGTAQGIAIHSEYKAYVASLMEIDCRPATVHRNIPDAFTGPRITKITMVIDTGMAVNPKGVQAQLMGGAMDGIAQALTAGMHFKDGLPLEGSWDNYWYTRQWNSPPEMEIVVLQTPNAPGGAGELGCGVSQAAAACAYARAVGKMPTEFPVNFHEPLGFTPTSTVPSIPQSPTDGLHNAR